MKLGLYFMNSRLCKLISLFSLILVLFLPLSCGDRPLEPEEDSDYIPNTVPQYTDLLALKVGNRWTYDYENKKLGITGKSRWEITGTRKVRNETRHLLRQTLPAINFNQTLILSAKSDCIYVTGFINSVGSETTYSSPRYYIKYPIDVGTSFTNWQGFQYELKAIGKIIETDAGIFDNVIKFFIYDGEKSEGVLFWVNKVGPIVILKNSLKSGDPIPLEKRSLSNYQLN